MIERHPFLSNGHFYPRHQLASRGLPLVGLESCCVWCWTGGLLIALLLLAACATAPPGNVSNACAIFAEYDDWYPDAQAASRRWGVPLPVLLAIIWSGSEVMSPPPRPLRTVRTSHPVHGSSSRPRI